MALPFDAWFDPAELAYNRIRAVTTGFYNIFTNNRARLDVDAEVALLRIIIFDIQRRQDEVTVQLAVPNVGVAAQRIRNDNTYDLAAELALLNAEVNAVKNEADSLLPRDGNGWVQEYQIVDGARIGATVTAASMATLRALVDSATANINIVAP